MGHQDRLAYQLAQFGPSCGSLHLFDADPLGGLHFQYEKSDRKVEDRSSEEEGNVQIGSLMFKRVLERFIRTFVRDRPGEYRFSTQRNRQKHQ